VPDQPHPAREGPPLKDRRQQGLHRGGARHQAEHVHGGGEHLCARRARSTGRIEAWGASLLLSVAAAAAAAHRLPPLNVVRVEERLRCLSAARRGQLPREVEGVGVGGVAAEPSEGRPRVRAIADEEGAAVRELARDEEVPPPGLLLLEREAARARHLLGHPRRALLEELTHWERHQVEEVTHRVHRHDEAQPSPVHSSRCEETLFTPRVHRHDEAQAARRLRSSQY